MALALLRPLDDPRSLALCQARLGAALASLGLLAAAREHLDQALQLATANDELLAETVQMLRGFLHLGWAQAALHDGDPSSASSWLERVEADCQRARAKPDHGRSLAQNSDDIRAALRGMTPLLSRLRGALVPSGPLRG